MKKERKVEALKREIERLRGQITTLSAEKQDLEKTKTELQEQIQRYLKADSDERIRKLEEDLREARDNYQEAYKEAVETSRKNADMFLKMKETRDKYEKLMKEKIKNVKR